MSRSQKRGTSGSCWIVQIEQTIGKLIQREPDLAKPVGQTFEHVVQFAATRYCMRRDQLIVCPADLFVKLNVRSAAQTAPLCVLMKNAADKERVIPNVRPKQKRLLWGGAGQRDQKVGDVLFRGAVSLI